MSVIAAYYYNEGRRIREVAIDERVELDKNRSGFCWIGLSEPSVNELRALQATYNLHPLAIDNAMHPICRRSSKFITASFTSSPRRLG